MACAASSSTKLLLHQDLEALKEYKQTRQRRLAQLSKCVELWRGKFIIHQTESYHAAMVAYPDLIDATADEINDAHFAEKRLACLRKMKAYERGQKALKALAEGKFTSGREKVPVPAEIVLRILTIFAEINSPFELTSLESLAAIERQFIGDIKTASQLSKLFAEAVLKGARIQIKLVGAASALPTFVRDLPHSIQHLELECCAKFYYGRAAYPSAILKTTRVLPTILIDVPRVKILTLALKIRVVGWSSNSPPRAWQHKQCLTSFTGVITARKAILDLLTEMQGLAGSITTILRPSYTNTWTDIPEDWGIDEQPEDREFEVNGTMTADEVFDAVF